MKNQMPISIVTFALLVSLYIADSAIADPPPLPARIAGTVTVNGVALEESTDTGYEFTVTSADGTLLTPDPTVSSGLNDKNWYILDIPIKDTESQPGGVEEASELVIVAYKNGSRLEVTSPSDGRITVGKAGSATRVDLKLTLSSSSGTTSGTSTTPTACGAGAMTGVVVTILGFAAFRPMYKRR